MINATKRRNFPRLVLWLLLLLGSVPPVAAHSRRETAHISQAPIGKYNLTVWSAPTYQQANELKFSAVVTDAAQQPVLDCEVTLLLTLPDSDLPPISLAMQPASQSSNLRYEIAQVLPQAGTYQVSLSIRDGSGLVGTESFSIIKRPFWQQLPAFGALLVLLHALLTLGVQALVLKGLWQPAQIHRPARLHSFTST